MASFSCMGLYRRHLHFARRDDRKLVRFPFCVRCGAPPKWWRWEGS